MFKAFILFLVLMGSFSGVSARAESVQQLYGNGSLTTPSCWQSYSFRGCRHSAFGAMRSSRCVASRNDQDYDGDGLPDAIMMQTYGNYGTGCSNQNILNTRHQENCRHVCANQGYRYGTCSDFEFRWEEGHCSSVTDVQSAFCNCYDSLEEKNAQSNSSGRGYPGIIPVRVRLATRSADYSLPEDTSGTIPREGSSDEVDYAQFYVYRDGGGVGLQLKVTLTVSAAPLLYRYLRTPDARPIRGTQPQWEVTIPAGERSTLVRFYAQPVNETVAWQLGGQVYKVNLDVAIPRFARYMPEPGHDKAALSFQLGRKVLPTLHLSVTDATGTIPASLSDNPNDTAEFQVSRNDVHLDKELVALVTLDTNGGARPRSDFDLTGENGGLSVAPGRPSQGTIVYILLFPPGVREQTVTVVPKYSGGVSSTKCFDILPLQIGTPYDPDPDYQGSETGTICLVPQKKPTQTPAPMITPAPLPIK